MAYYGASILSHSCSNSAQMQSTALQWRIKAIHSINERLQVEKQAPSIPLIIAIAGSICTELEVGDSTMDKLLESPLTRIHINGLQSPLKSGGWSRIKRRSASAAWLIFWVDMQLSGLVLDGFTRSLESTSRDTHSMSTYSPTTKTLSTGSIEILYIYDQFHIAANFRWHSLSSTRQAGLILEPIWLFQPFSAVYPILRREKTVRVSRLVPLIFISLLLHKTQNSSFDHKSALYHLYRQSLVDLAVKEHPACEVLMWALMTDTQKAVMTDVSMIECTLRLVHETTKLSPGEQMRLTDTLCDFILFFQEEAVIERSNWRTPYQFEKVLTNARVAAAERVRS